MGTLDYNSWPGHRFKIDLQDQIGEQLDGWEDGTEAACQKVVSIRQPNQGCRD